MMLQRNPAKRPTASEALKHEWIREGGSAPDTPMEPEVRFRASGLGGGRVPELRLQGCLSGGGSVPYRRTTPTIHEVGVQESSRAPVCVSRASVMACADGPQPVAATTPPPKKPPTLV
jgi:hypothetical protein